jgi:hypothetical protein
LKRRTPRGIWALRGVTVAIALVVLIVVATVAYSVYEDYSAVRSEISSGGHIATASAVYNQSADSEVISFNIEVPNGGLYSLNVTVACSSASSDVVCHSAQVDVPPGQEQTMYFSLTVNNLAQYLSSSDRTINGTVVMTLEPFASLSVASNFTSLVQVPQGGP